MTNPPTRYLHSIGTNPNDWSDEWMRAFGYVAYYFGQLEYASIWLADCLQCSASEDGFMDRCIDARKRLVPLLPDLSLRKEWKAFFLAAERCAPQRNNILHNPLAVNAEQLLKTGVNESAGIIMLKKAGRPTLALADVQKFQRELVALHFGMLDLMKRTSGGSVNSALQS